MFLVARTRMSESDLLLKLSFVALCYIDLALTLLALRNGFIEHNPIMLAMVRTPFELVLVKGAAPAMIAWLTPGRLLLLSIVFMLGVTAWNLTQLLIAAS